MLTIKFGKCCTIESGLRDSRSIMATIGSKNFRSENPNDFPNVS